MYAQSVVIGPEFFTKSFNDYRDKYWAFAREIMQNSLDCGSTRIGIEITEFDQETRVAVRNDGEPMTREILINKLLCLGSSGKDFKGAVGGFGKAKEILYFAHKSYSIASGDWNVSGSGAGYDIEPGESYPGTCSHVVWSGLVGDSLRRAFRTFISLCGRRKVTYTLDGEIHMPEVPRFVFRRPLDHEGVTWANLGISSFQRNLVLVRLGGIPMFTENSDFPGTVIIELQGTSGERLTANRDSLRYPYSTRFRDLITQMAVDRQSTLKLEQPVYTRYGGPKLRGTAKTPIDDFPSESVSVAARRDQDAGGGIVVIPQDRNEAATSLLPYEFIVKNCVRRRVPREFDPLDVQFSDYAHWLAWAYAGCLTELHRLFEIDHEFSTGFVFSDMAEAEFETSSEYGRVYYINPVRIGKRSNKHRYKKSQRGEIVSVVAHEFVHGALDQSYHGEDYANWLTNVMGKVCNHWRRFARHFQ